MQSCTMKNRGFRQMCVSHMVCVNEFMFQLTGMIVLIFHSVGKTMVAVLIAIYHGCVCHCIVREGV